MTSVNDIFSPVNQLIGQTLTDPGAYHDVLILRFGEYEIHVSCFARILHNREILLTTQDYQSWDKEDYRHNDMYLNIAKHGAAVIGQRVRSVDVTPTNDLFVVLENDAQIEVFCSQGSHSFSEEEEQWFFYKPKDSSYPNMAVYPSGAEKWISESE